MKDIFKFFEQPKFRTPSLVVSWQEDAGKLGPEVIDYLNDKINCKSFCEIEPLDFFSLAGVAVEDNVAQFPQGTFYYSESNSNLVMFRGSEPRFERHTFLNAISDFAEHYCQIKDLYTIGGTISPIAHTSSRRILAVFNQLEIQQNLRGYGLEDMNWKGPPAISSYLLWIAKRRGVPGVSLWTEVPFYLSASKDLEAIKTTLSFLNNRFSLSLDLRHLDEQVRQQNAKMAQLMEDDPDINKYIGMLEGKLSLGGDEQMELTRKVTEVLEKAD